MPLAALLRLFGRQDWIRFGLRNRVIRRLSAIGRPTESSFDVPFDRVRYHGRLDNELDWQVFYFGAYEKPFLGLLKRLAEALDRPVFIDIGANVGHHTLYMSSYASSLHAFEPSDPLSRLIEDKIMRNRLTSVTIHRVGLGARDEDLLYYASTTANTGTGSFVLTHDATDHPAGTLSVRNGDAYFLSHGIEGGRQLWKIDVEGFECSVLDGLRGALARDRPTILMEYSSSTRKSLEPGKSLQDLLPNGYCIFAVHADRPYLVMFNRTRIELEAFNPSIEGELLLVPEELRDVVVSAAISRVGTSGF